MRKLCARWVQCLHTTEQKQHNEEVSSVPVMFHSNKFLCCFITMNDTWVPHFTPEMKEQWKHWTERGESAPSAGKVMASVFWDAHVIISLNIFKKGKQSTESIIQTYCNVWRMKSRENGSIWWKRKCCFIQTLHQFTHPLSWWPKSKSYSLNNFFPDLVPLDCFLL